ncbi:MAG: UvrD-helicase domain-containing protein [Anaerolineae bacterium]|nr:UvrD-helicase domain-containing protein [Anaerolineae bacterium]
MYELIHKPTYDKHLIDLDKTLQQRIVKDLEILRQAPNNAASKNIENLGGKRGLWTYRVNDNFRILYAIHGQFVQLLDVGKHDHIDRLVDGYKAGGWSSLEDLGEVLDPTTLTTAADISNWPIGRPTRPAGTNTTLAAASGELLPMEITERALQRLGIPPTYHQDLIACQTEDDLLNLSPPEDIFESICNWQYNQPTLADIAQEPNYVLKEPEDLERYADGDLLGFLLLLDPEQEQLVDFALSGPALIKGGPGSGKSTIALYRLAEIVTRRALPGMAPRVLFTTYTNALIKASEQLLTQLLGELPEGLEISTVDSVAKRIVEGVSGQPHTMVKSEHWKAAFDSARAAFYRSSDPTVQRVFGRQGGALSDGYLRDEIEWIIEGQGLSTLDEYLAVERPGRQRPLDAGQRGAIWKIYQHVCTFFDSNGLTTWNALRRKALDYLADPRWQQAYGNYDYVFVDEAQDLTPVGLRLCLRLCASPTGLFLTADHGQSLYNKGFSWNKVHKDLRFVGRTRILRRNYRTTRQIAEAAHAFLRGTQAGDEDTLDQKYVHSGSRPRVYGAADEKSQMEWLYGELHAAMRQLRQDWSGVAILVPKKDLGERIAGYLEARGVPAWFVEGRALDLSAPCAKVMTIHSAKGLEFPIVALPFVSQHELPRRLDSIAPDYEEQLAEQRRLFYVACTRAMRRLFITYDCNSPSPFIRELSPELWEFCGQTEAEDLPF